MTNGLTYVKAAAIVLRDASYPLSASEIFREIRNRQLIHVGDKSGHESLRVAINRDIKVKGSNSVFVRTGPGRYILNPEAATEFFATTHQRISSALEQPDKVLVVKANLIEDIGHFHGVRHDYKQYLELLNQSNEPMFLDRFATEGDPSHKQIVSYVIIKYQNQLLRFKRGEVNEVGEYVDGYYSIGFGGHVQHRDYNLLTIPDNDSGYSESVKREILEEAGVNVDSSNCEFTMIGVLNDDSTPLGKLHFAFVHLLEIASPEFRINEKEQGISNLRFVPMSQISKEFRWYEYWSKLCLLAFFRERLEFTCYVQSDPDFPVREYSRCFLAVGAIGSGKSLACEILEHEFGYVRVPCSQILFDLIGYGSIEDIGRRDLQDAGYEFITRPNGHHRLADGILEYISKHRGEHYVFDGLRYPASLTALRQKLAEPITVLYVENIIDRSYEFYRAREDHDCTFQQFLQILEHPVEREVEAFLPEAKVAIFNHGPLESYTEALRNFFSQELVEDAWDVNAPRRHQQMTSGIDLTFSKVLAPVIIDILISQPGHEEYSVLDVGCGTGVLTRVLSEHVKHVTGVDPSTESVCIAREHTAGVPNISLEAAAIEDFATEEQPSYDFIIAHMVLNNIQYLDKALTQIYSLLRDNRLFVFSIPHPCFFAERKRAMFNNYTYLEPSYHEIRFTISKDPEPLPRKTSYYHRPISFYEAALQRAGFVHEEMMEPRPDEETLKLYPNPATWDYPHSLVMVCRKKRRQPADA